MSVSGRGVGGRALLFKLRAGGGEVDGCGVGVGGLGVGAGYVLFGGEKEGGRGGRWEGTMISEKESG